MKQPVKCAVLATVMVFLLGSLSTASAQSRREGGALTTCDVPLGTMSIIERPANDPDMPPMLRFVMQMQQRQGLLSTPQLLRLLVQRSNCFTVVERSATGMAAMERERALMQSGEMEEGSRMGGGQVVASDYSLNGEVLFSGATGGFGGGGGGMMGGLIGSRKNEAWVTLTTVDNRSGVQLAMAEGSATKRSWSGLAAMFGGGGVGGFGAYSKTPEGKIILPAFVNAFNIMVSNLREHQARQPARPTPAQQQTAIVEQTTAGEPALMQANIEAPVQAEQAPAAPSMSLYEAQHRLTRHGYSPGPVNGEMGEETANALRDFQMDKNLPVTGQVDEATANALRALNGQQ